MKVDILNARQLFMKDIHYVIPEFQRRYVWSKDEQWESFWEDVKNVASDCLEKIQHPSDELKSQEVKPHFLGAIIIQQQLTPVPEIEKRDVIDGQQRLTTLQILLDSIQEVCEKYDQQNIKQIAKRLSRFVTNDKDLYDSEHVFKLWPSKFDQEIFKYVMDNKLDASDFKETRIAQAHEFFKQQVTDWLGDAPDDIQHRINALEEAVTTMLQIAVIDLEAQADPHVIFETLNARGTPLAQFELIKNFVVSKSQQRTSDMWGDLDSEWWKEETTQGRLTRPRLDILFNYWLAMRKGSDVSPAKVFTEFRNQSENEDMQHLMSEITRDFENYKEYEQGKGRNPIEKSFYYHMYVMQAGAITPILLVLLSDKTSLHTTAFEALESFLIRRMICRYHTKDYNRMSLDLAGKLKRGKVDDIDKTIVEFLQGQTAYTRKWPSDDEVEESLLNSPLYSRLTRGRLRLVLEGVEQQLRTSNKVDDHELPKNLTIEHMMPVAWKVGGEWPLFEPISEEERNTIINTIGNLTLVTQPLNSAMSNAGWVDKREELQKYSLLMLNKELRTQEAWNEMDIKDRSSQMAKIISQRWPGPDSQEWNNIK